MPDASVVVDVVARVVVVAAAVVEVASLVVVVLAAVVVVEALVVVVAARVVVVVEVVRLRLNMLEKSAQLQAWAWPAVAAHNAPSSARAQVLRFKSVSLDNYG